MDEKHGSETVQFEDGMNSLEALVARLESGELSLEEALRAFEEGVGLVRLLNHKLTEAEQRIELLSRAEDGTMRLEIAQEEKL